MSQDLVPNDPSSRNVVASDQRSRSVLPYQNSQNSSQDSTQDPRNRVEYHVLGGARRAIKRILKLVAKSVAIVSAFILIANYAGKNILNYALTTDMTPAIAQFDKASGDPLKAEGKFLLQGNWQTYLNQRGYTNVKVPFDCGPSLLQSQDKNGVSHQISLESWARSYQISHNLPQIGSPNGPEYYPARDIPVSSMSLGMHPEQGDKVLTPFEKTALDTQKDGGYATVLTGTVKDGIFSVQSRKVNATLQDCLSAQSAKKEGLAQGDARFTTCVTNQGRSLGTVFEAGQEPSSNFGVYNETHQKIPQNLDQSGEAVGFVLQGDGQTGGTMASEKFANLSDCYKGSLAQAARILKIDGNQDNPVVITCMIHKDGKDRAVGVMTAAAQFNPNQPITPDNVKIKVRGYDGVGRVVSMKDVNQVLGQ